MQNEHAARMQQKVRGICCKGLSTGSRLILVLTISVFSCFRQNYMYIAQTNIRQFECAGYFESHTLQYVCIYIKTI